MFSDKSAGVVRPPRKTCHVIAPIVATLLVSSAAAQSLDISWHTIDGGGNLFTSGGTLEISGTIGQADAQPTVMTGGTIRLVGGFWGVTLIPRIEGDTDGDGDVDLTDLAIVLINFGGPGSGSGEGDFDGDGDVDLIDLALLLTNFGTGV